MVNKKIFPKNKIETLKTNTVYINGKKITGISVDSSFKSIEEIWQLFLSFNQLFDKNGLGNDSSINNSTSL